MGESLLWRRDVIGASDAPAIVGVDVFKTAGDLWAVKTGRVPDDTDERSPINPRDLGSALEPLLLKVAAADLGVPGLASQVWYRHPDAPLATSVDGLALDHDPPTLVEAKTCGILNRPSRLLAAYGDDGTDEVPESVLVQVTHTLVVLAAQPELPPIRHALIVALLGDGRGLRRYHVEFDPALAEELIGAEVDFWRNYVEPNRPPPPAQYDVPSLPTLKAWRRRAELPAVPVDPVLMLEWLRARAVAKQAQANEETCRRFLLNELGDAEVGESEHGRITYRASDRKEYTVKAQTVRTLRFHDTNGVAA